MHQHGPAVELVGVQQQGSLPRLGKPLAVGPVDDAAAAAAAVVPLGVPSGLSPKVLGAPRGPHGRGVVAGNKVICKNRLWGQKTGGKGFKGGSWTQRVGLRMSDPSLFPPSLPSFLLPFFFWMSDF